jgi:tryptophan synthase alpha chain
MPENRLSTRLSQAAAAGEKCLIPYLTGGYPDINTTVELLLRCDRIGCQAIELGIPFSDSVADGPVIQESFYRALDAGFRVGTLFDAVAAVRERVSAGLLAMVSMSVVRRWGVDEFARRAAENGFDGLIVPDVPVDECESLSGAAAGHGLHNVLMAAPTSSPRRREWIARRSTGFIYLIAAKGITGQRDNLAVELDQSVASMRAAASLPVMVGFGIHSPEQVRQVCGIADGAIVGSAIIRHLSGCVDRRCSLSEAVDSVGGFIETLYAGAREASS